MGHIYVKAVFYNPPDYIEYLRGERRVEDIGKIETNALVDSGATFQPCPKIELENSPYHSWVSMKLRLQKAKGSLSSPTLSLK